MKLSGNERRLEPRKSRKRKNVIRGNEMLNVRKGRGAMKNKGMQS